MDIAIIVPLLDKYGGAERVVIECVRRWQTRHRITLYSTAFDKALLGEHGVGDGVALRLLNPHFEGEHSMLLNAVLLPKIWRQEIGRHDIYHTHLWPTHLIDLHPMVWYPHEPLRILHDLRFEQNAEQAGGAIARNIHIYPKYNYDRIEDSPYEAYLAAIDAMDKSAKPERVVANSAYSSRYLEDVYGEPVSDIIYPGVDVDGFIDLPIDRNLFVTVGQLWPHKRINLLIEAISMTDETQLVVVGSGPERQRLVDLAARIGVSDRVFFMSGLTNRELRLIMARACAFVFASIKEPFGIVVLEAMAAGRAVVAVKEGGFVEVCKDECGLLLPAFPSAFAKALSHLQANPGAAQAMGRAGRDAALNYSWQRTADELEAVLVEAFDAWAVAQPPARPRPPSETLVGIQYYLWYGEGYGAAHWNDHPAFGAVTEKPLLGYYGSARGRTIEHHFALFRSMGLDYAILNLHVDEGGVNEIELLAIQHAFDIAAARGEPLRLAIQISPYNASCDELLRVIRLIEARFAGRDAYLRINDRPLLFWFWSGVLDGDAGYVGSLVEATEAFSNVAISLRLPAGMDEPQLTFGMFDGMAPFSPLELASEQQWEKVWNAAMSGSEKAGLPLRIATLSPGYDDRSLDDDRRRGNAFREVPRRGGDTYRRGMAFVEGLPALPDLVVISTFNEYHENTHIEPTVAHGDVYLELTRAFVERLKKETAARGR